ncbi:MAG: restriction endonuclease subunit S [Marinobacterium sp.]|nr:restriction endonuclease subunit S [Marinobacterium sp.]
MSELKQCQAISAGYKTTEVGVIPEDWSCVHLGELGSVVRGGSPRPAGDPKYFNGKFIPWLTVASLTNIPISQHEVHSTATMLTELGAKQSRTLEPNTLIISNSGATLGVAKILGIKCCANDGVAALINQKSGNRSFIAHYLNTKTRELHDQVATGNGQPNLNTDLIKAIPLPFPLEEEQSAIASTLSDVDALITELEKLIAKKQAIKTATMQQLLTGKTRLPQFALREDGTPKGTKPSELGEIPEDWEICCLSHLCDVRDGTHDSPKYQENGIPLVTSKNIINNTLDLSDVSCISIHDATEINKRSKVDLGDVIMSMIGTIGSVVLIEKEPIFCIKNIALFKPKEIQGAFLFHLITSSIFQKYLDESLDGGIQKFVSLGTLRKLNIVKPSSEEQLVIASTLSDMDSEIQVIEKRLSKTRQIKQGMMQALLTGRTRLVKPEVQDDAES